MRRQLNPFLFTVALAFVVMCAAGDAHAQSVPAPSLRVALLSFGATPIADRTERILAGGIKTATGMSMIDTDLARAAAKGTGYQGSLNLTTQEATDLGSAIGADFYFLGDVQTLQRSPPNKPVYQESYATIFLVSARTGRLVFWDRQTQTAPTTVAAETLLATEVERNLPRYLTALRDAATTERAQRFAAIGRDLPVIEETPADDSPNAEGFRAPAPFRRVSPVYTAAADTAEVIATVDAQVDLDIDGEVQDVQIARWAGFGLDDAVTTAIRQMHFRPATRHGKPFPIRVLIRYNFRKPK